MNEMKCHTSGVECPSASIADDQLKESVMVLTRPLSIRCTTEEIQTVV